MGKARATFEGSMRDDSDALGNDNALQSGATGERISIDGPQSFRELNVPEVLATNEGTDSDDSHALWDDNAGEILTIHERIGKDLSGPCGNFQVTVLVNQFLE